MNFDIKRLHHAYLIEGGKDTGDSIISWLEQSGIKCIGSSNFYRITNPNFGIEDSHNIKAFQSQLSGGEKKIIIIEAESFTNEAQNALLKVFEEPSQDSHFFIIIPNKDNLLVTLRSRMEYVRTGKSLSSAQGRPQPKADESRVQASGWKDNQKEAVNFLKENLKARLDIVKDMADALSAKGRPASGWKDKDEEENSKNVVLEFLNSIETLLYNYHKSEGINLDKDKIFIFEEIANCRKYLSDRGASVKMLLEHLSFILPVT